MHVHYGLEVQWIPVDGCMGVCVYKQTHEQLDILNTYLQHMLQMYIVQRGQRYMEML